jgi:Stage II sporulation protein E (SpoIIE)
MPEILAFLPRRLRTRSLHLPLSFLSLALFSAPNSMPKLAIFLVSLLIVSSAAAAPSSALLLPGLDSGPAPINGPWQFHTGDNPIWAAPDFDDSAWEPIQVNQTWEAQGHTGYTGYAWYRRHLDLGSLPSGFNLALMLSRPEDVAAVYWNGRFVGSLGQFPPHPLWYWYGSSRIFLLPLATRGVLAIRVWKSPHTYASSPSEGGIIMPPLIGGLVSLQGLENAQRYEKLHGSIFGLFLDLSTVVLGVACLALWLRSRREWLLFWVGISLLTGFYDIFLYGHANLSFRALYGSIGPVVAVHDASVYFVLIYLLELNGNRRLVRFTAWLSGIILLLSFVDTIWEIGNWAWRFPRAFLALDIGATIPGELFEFFGLYLVALVIRRRLDFARWFLVVAVVFNVMTQAVTDTLQLGVRWTHWTIGPQINGVLFTIAGNEFRLATLSSLTQLVAILYAAWRYSLEQRQRQNALEQEYLNAQELQRVLIPAALPASPGYSIQTAYHPAHVVGGDFFQVIALASGGTLIVLGDVSGKGLGAAMTVSLIVGAVSILARSNPRPAAILNGLNQELCLRLNGGFATCLCISLDAEGHCTLANAGHFAPYRNGVETPSDPSMPLGISIHETYSETQSRLDPGDALTFLTDGVVEAQSSTGELFGFDRTQQISHLSAGQIARAAQSFGQQDDITVLTLQYAPAEVVHA